MMPGTPMPLPDWYDEAREDLESCDLAPKTMSFQPVQLERVDEYSTFFAEYDLQGKHLLLHLFPREGFEDGWSDGHYINRCQNCRAEVAMPSKPSELRPCPRCGHTGLIYVPGRVEEKGGVEFPEDARDIIKDAVDQVWLGEVAIELIPELGAYAVQLQHVRNTAKVVGLSEFVDAICEALHSKLSQNH
jgi:DNA-directed RNA polymerase subunit RPC12/RpoP